MKKMKLDVGERLNMTQLLPQQGNLIEMRLGKDLTGKVEFSQEEMEKVGLVQKEQSLTWDSKEEFEIEFTETELNFLNDQVTKLDAENKITRQQLALCEKIRSSVEKPKEKV